LVMKRSVVQSHLAAPDFHAPPASESLAFESRLGKSKLAQAGCPRAFVPLLRARELDFSYISLFFPDICQTQARSYRGQIFGRIG